MCAYTQACTCMCIYAYTYVYTHILCVYISYTSYTDKLGWPAHIWPFTVLTTPRLHNSTSAPELCNKV